MGLPHEACLGHFNFHCWCVLIEAEGKKSDNHIILCVTSGHVELIVSPVYLLRLTPGVLSVNGAILRRKERALEM